MSLGITWALVTGQNLTQVVVGQALCLSQAPLPLLLLLP